VKLRYKAKKQMSFLFRKKGEIDKLLRESTDTMFLRL